MKVALVHDYIKEYGGAERVLETLHEMFPDAPIYTSLYFPEFLGPHRQRFEKMDVHSSWLQYIPFAYKLISPLRLLSPWVFKNLNLSTYDVIIASQTGAYFPNLVNKGKARLVTYTHTPPRYLYGYKTAREWKNNVVLRVLGELANHMLRMVDFAASKNVDQFVANSKEVQARIKKFYRRDALVIYPPAIEISNMKDQKSKTQIKNQKQFYYLAGGRLARAKGMDVIVDAFIKNGKSLKIFGKGFAGFENELRKKIHAAVRHPELDSGSQGIPGQARNDNIQFVGEVSDEEKMELMSNAKAYIFASYDEDFGITPVEAMSVGAPVIAYKSGGVQETVVDGKTGVFYDENTPDTLNEALAEFEKLQLSPEDCQKQAEKFSKKRFEKEIKHIIEHVV